MTQRPSQSPPTDDASTTATQPNEVLAGSIERVTFHNAESGFCVLRIKTYGHCGLIAMMGHAAIGSAGVWVTIDWH